MGSVSDRLMQLRPVIFRYNDSVEKGRHTLRYGLIAEEVAKVYPDLVEYDKQGKPFTIYYHLLTPLLLNEFQKEHRQNAAMKTAHRAEMSALLAKQQAEMTALKSELAALKVDHEQEMRTLAKLSAFARTAQAKEAQQPVAFVQR